MTNRRSKNKAVNEEWKVIQGLLIHSQLEIAARCVTSEDNAADKFSRGVNDGCGEENRMVLDIPADLREHFENGP